MVAHFAQNGPRLPNYIELDHYLERNRIEKPAPPPTA